MLLPKKNGCYLTIYTVVVCFLMVLIVGLRDISVGKVDTEYIYTPQITKYFSYNYQEIWDYQSKDKVFYIITKIISNISENINFILFIIGIPYIVVIGRLIRKYSKHICLSFILFLGLTYFTMSFFLLRQVLAMSLTILAFDAIVERKPIKFIILVLLASLFHQTALIFLLAYPISRIKPGRIQWICVAVACVLSLFAQSSILSSVFTVLNILFSDASRYDYYETAETGLGYTGFLIQLIVFICITFAYKRQNPSKKKTITLKDFKLIIRKNNITESEAFDNQIDIIYNLATCSLIIMPFSAVIGEFWRVACYFGVFNIILLPNAISTLKSTKLKQQLVAGVAFCFVLYFLFIHLENASAENYIFFWMS